MQLFKKLVCFTR